VIKQFSINKITIVFAQKRQIMYISSINQQITQIAYSWKEGRINGLEENWIEGREEGCNMQYAFPCLYSVEKLFT